MPNKYDPILDKYREDDADEGLLVVTHDGTLTGDGTVASPLSAPGDVTATWGSISGSISNQVDLKNELEGKLNLDQTTTQEVINGAPVFDAIDFAETPTSPSGIEGRLRWNATDGTLDLGMSGGDITMQLGQEMFTKVRNDTGATLTNGSVVYISGRTGVYPDVKLARSDAESTSRVLGIATQDILNTGDKFGFVTTVGYVRGIKTDYTGAGNWGTTWTTGDRLYVSKTVAGQLTNVEPAVPHHSDIVGTVGIVHQTLGTILVLNEKHYALEELTDVNGGTWNTNGQLLVWNTDAGYFTPSNALPISHHYTGFPDRTATSLGFNDGTYTLTLTATSDPIWIDGISYTINTLTKQLTVAQEAVSGLYWFWLTQTGGTVSLNCDLIAPGFDKCLVATVYWNTTTNKGIISDERHWMGRDQKLHEYLHETVGARYTSGMGGTFADTTIQIEAGSFHDEDIEHLWADPITTVRVMYHNGDADWVWDDLTTPYKVVNPGVDNNLRYNNINALATVDNNKYVNYWVYATGDVSYPIQVFLGTAQYVTLALARAATPPSLGSLGSAENKLIYKLTYQNNGGTPDYNEATDYRTAAILPTGSYVATDHGTLTGLTDDDHPQYVKKAGDTMTGALVTTDHGTATNAEVVGIVYGTGSAPTANTTPIGTLFIKYIEP